MVSLKEKDILISNNALRNDLHLNFVLGDEIFAQIQVECKQIKFLIVCSATVNV